MTFKHISLDAWNTVLTPNKLFAKLRTAALSEFFGCDEELAKNIYTKVKRQLDSMAENEGVGFSTEYAWKLLANNFPAAEVNVEDVQQTVEELFQRFDCLPTILPETVSAIKALHGEGVTFSITSNTNFISGSILSNVIARYFKNGEMSFMLFSDLTERTPTAGGVGSIIHRIAKPNYDMFAKVQKFANLRHGHLDDWNLSKSQIVHIGDNVKCDQVGAEKYGFRSILIDNAQCLPACLNGLLAEIKESK